MNNSTSIIDQQRRQFLKAITKMGLTTAACRALPLIGGLMATRQARAAQDTCRVVFVYAGNGAPSGLWLPSNGVLNQATAAYEGLQDICNFREVEIIGSGHGNTRKCMGQLRWTRDWTSDSIDQQIASVIGTRTPYSSYALGVQTNGQDLIGRTGGALVPSQDNPSAAYQQLFGGSPPSGDPRLLQKQRIMDLHHQAIQELKSRLGTLEIDTLDKHATALTDIENRLNNPPSASEACSSPAWNNRGSGTTGEPAIPFAHTAELQSDIIVAAMKCGLTRVMTLQLGWHQATWSAHDTQFQGTQHNSCHGAPAEANAEMTNYLSRCIAYLVRRLVEEDDPVAPGTKMIDNTVVVQVTDMGDGQDHTAADGPNMIATRMPSFKRGTVARGGTNYQILEAVVEGLGLGAYKGKDVGTHKIWPCADGQPDTSLLV